MKTNKFRRLLIAAALLVLAVAPSFAQDKKVVTIWVPWGGSDGDYYANAGKEYTAANPDVEVNVITVAGSGLCCDTQGKLAASVASGDVPDGVVYWSPSDIPSLVAAGVIEPFDSYLDAGGIKSDIYTAQTWAASQYDNQVYALPQLQYDRILYYNKDMFKAAGLDPEKPPTTIEELDAAAEKLTSKAADGSYDVLGFLPWAGQGQPSIWTYVYGGSFWDAENQVINLKGPATLAMLQWQATYVEKYGADELTRWSSAVGKLGQSSGGEPFVIGKLAMEINGNWHINFIKQFNPDLNYGVAPIPQAPGGKANTTVVGQNVWLLPTGSKNPEEVVKFIAWLAEPERSANNADTLFNISHVVEGAKLQKLNDDLNFKLSIDLASGPAATFDPLFPNAGLIDSALNPQIDNVHLGTLSPEDALNQAQTDLEFAIQQNQ